MRFVLQWQKGVFGLHIYRFKFLHRARHSALWSLWKISLVYDALWGLDEHSNLKGFTKVNLRNLLSKCCTMDRDIVILSWCSTSDIINIYEWFFSNKWLEGWNYDTFPACAFCDQTYNFEYQKQVPSPTLLICIEQRRASREETSWCCVLPGNIIGFI